MLTTKPYFGILDNTSWDERKGGSSASHRGRRRAPRVRWAPQVRL